MERTFLGPRIVVVTFITLMGAFGLNLSAGQFFSPLHQTYHWSLTILSLAVSLNMIIWGIFQPVMGRLIDRFGAKPVIVGSATLMGVSFLLSSTISQLWQFFLYYGVFAAIGFAGCGSMANSVLISRWYSKKRVVMLSRSSMGMNVGQLLLLPLTGMLIASCSFRVAFIVLGMIMLLIIVPAVIFGTKNEPGTIGQFPDGDVTSIINSARSAPLSEAIRSREFWLATLGFVTCGYTLYLVTIHLPKFAVDLGGGVALGGQLLGIAASCSAISMWITGQLTRTYSKKKLLIVLYTIRLIAFVWLALTHSIWQLYIFVLIFGVSSMPIIPLVTGLISERFGANAIGSILGTSWLLHQVFAALGVFLGGYLHTTYGTYELAFWTGAMILAVGCIVTLLLDEQKTSQSNSIVGQT